MLSKAGEDVDERIDEVWTAEKEVVETYAVDARAGVVTHSYFVMFVHWMHGEVPSWKMRIHLVVGDVDGVSFIIKLLHLLENALFEDRIALESWNHRSGATECHFLRVEGVEDSGNFFSVFQPW